MTCKNPETHKPHAYLADSDAVALSHCPGRAALREMEGRLYTKEELDRHAEVRVRMALKGILRNLAEVRAQRGAERIQLPGGRDAHLKRMGEIWGLDVAIAALKRRIG